MISDSIVSPKIILPIPNNVALSGLTLYLQSLGFGGPTPLQVSNAFAIGLSY